jgi:hypothetical protein
MQRISFFLQLPDKHVGEKELVEQLILLLSLMGGYYFGVHCP